MKGARFDARAWISDNVSIEPKLSSGTLEVKAAVILPVEDQTCYELITHPDNAEIFHGVTRCVCRKIVANNGRGAQLIEVENESDWNFFVIKGRVRTRLVVAQDMQAGVMHFTIAPGSTSVMKELYGLWKIHHLSSDDDYFMDDSEQQRPRCLVTLYQRLAPKNVPLFLLPTFAKYSIKQIVRTFEDLATEIHNINRGMPTLAPYMAACMKEIVSPDAACGTPIGPNSVLNAIEEASIASSSSASMTNSEFCPKSSLDFLMAHLRAKDKTGARDVADSMASVGSRPTAASMVSSSLTEPLSHALKHWELCNDEEVETHPVSIACVDTKHTIAEPLSRWQAVTALLAETWRKASYWADEKLFVTTETEEEEESEEENTLDRAWLVVA